MHLAIRCLIYPSLKALSGEEPGRIFAIEKLFVELAEESWVFLDEAEEDAPEGGLLEDDPTAADFLGENPDDGLLLPDESDLEPAPALGGAPELGILPSMGNLGVRLHQAGFGPTGWFLDYRGSGEMRVLESPDPGCVWSMGVCGEGAAEKAFVAQYHEETGATSKWLDVSELLQLRLHRVAEPPPWEATLPESERGIMLRDPTTNATAWRSEQLRAKTARALEFRPRPRPGAPDDPPLVQLKFWLYQVERAESAHLVWELPRIAELVHQKSFSEDLLHIILC